METIKTILPQMSQISKPQIVFILELLLLIMCLRGRANFRNFSRYRDHEKTFSRWYRQSFNFFEFNRLLLLPINSDKSPVIIAALDCSFIRKSGKYTEGLGKFYHGISGKVEKGLEISTLAVIDLEENKGKLINVIMCANV